MADIQIYDDILSQEEIEHIQKELVGAHFPWFLSRQGSTVTTDAYEESRDNRTAEYLQFTHIFNDNKGTPNSNYCELTDSILKKFIEVSKTKFQKLYKVKANLQTKCSNFPHNSYNTPHVDFDLPHLVLLYYVNDSDGDTFIFSRKFGDTNSENEVKFQLTPKAGRFLLFPGEYYHSGRHPISNDVRIVLNYNILAEFNIPDA
jgi:hypothetical protein